MTALFATLSKRSPLGWLRERDIDLLLCSELHAGGAFARSLAERIAGAGASISGAWVSHSELDGESDLLLALDTSDGRVVALVENKIAAMFQPRIRRADT